MQFRSTVLAVCALWLSACTTDTPMAPGSTCWLHVVDQPGKSENRLTICAAGTAATHHVYYPNSWFRLMPPTSCNSSGSVSPEPRDSMTFSFAQGRCANGRSLNPAVFTCARVADGLACRYGSHQLAFRPVEPRT